MRSIFTLINVLGLVTMGFGGLMMTCFFTSYFNNDGVTQAFFDATIISFFGGALMFVPTLKLPKKLSPIQL